MSSRLVGSVFTLVGKGRGALEAAWKSADGPGSPLTAGAPAHRRPDTTRGPTAPGVPRATGAGRETDGSDAGPSRVTARATGGEHSAPTHRRAGTTRRPTAREMRRATGGRARWPTVAMRAPAASRHGPPKPARPATEDTARRRGRQYTADRTSAGQGGRAPPDRPAAREVQRATGGAARGRRRRCGAQARYDAAAGRSTARRPTPAGAARIQGRGELRDQPPPARSRPTAPDTPSPGAQDTAPSDRTQHNGPPHPEVPRAAGAGLLPVDPGLHQGDAGAGAADGGRPAVRYVGSGCAP